MFKLLAIRPLEGCADYIQKCLKTGMMYYFCNDYIIEPGSHIRRRSKNIKPLKEDFFTVVSESDYFEDNSSERKSPTVSVSAIVGMNGDGKSTLVELMMRLINNCAISYKLCASPNDLRKVKNVKAELYYMVDNIVYRMAEEKDQKETRIWKVSELNPFNEKGEEMMRWEIDSVKIQKVEDDPKGFFFTIVSNYSHYAYNIYDYEKEWEIRGGEKDDDEKCWLHYVFHKNDGYLTPITLHPYRYNGNIDINVEKDLSKQRLLSLFLDAENPSKNEHSFRRVNGKDAIVLKLTEETESKLQQKAIIEYFQTTIRENRFNTIIEEIDRVDDEIYRAYSLLEFGDDYLNDYNKLKELLLPKLFIKPIMEIIEQNGEGFGAFANAVARLIKTKNIKAQPDTDIMTVINHYDKLYKKNEPYIKIGQYNDKAQELELRGDTIKALKSYKEAISISEDKLGKDHPFIVTTYDGIAGLYKKQGDYGKAMEYYQKALEIREKILGKEHLDTATSYNNIAGVYYAQGDYSRAMEYYMMALSIKEKALGLEHSSTASTYNNIGSVYDARGDYGKAIMYYMTALSIKEKDLGTKHPDTATSYNNIAGVYYAQGDYDKALAYYKKALKIWEKTLGTKHLYTAASYNNIGLVYNARGNYGKASKYYQKALETKEEVLGTEHPDTATSYNNIAGVFYAQGDYIKALEYYLKALKIREKVLGTEHPDTATSYNNIGVVYRKQGNYEVALAYYKKALEIREKVLGTEHLDTVTSYNNIAGVFYAQGNYEVSLAYYKKALEISEKVLGTEHPDTVTSYNNIAWAYFAQGNYDLALEYYQKALTVVEKALGTDHPDTAISYNNIGLVYCEQGDYDKALECHLKALEIDEKVLGIDHDKTATDFSNIGMVYDEQGDYDKALEYYQKALEINEKTLGAKHLGTLMSYYNVARLYKEQGNLVESNRFYKMAKEIGESKKEENRADIEVADSIITETIGVSDTNDEKLDQNEKGEWAQQLENKIKLSVGKGEQDKILENDDVERIVLGIEKQELLDTKKHKYLKFINATQLGRLDTLYRIMKSYNLNPKDITKIIDTKIVSKDYSVLSLKEKCQHYIIYKIYSIVSKYPQYQKAQKKDSIESIREFGLALEECVQDILNDHQSHITRKIRQVESFMKEDLKGGGLYNRLVTREKKSGALLVELDKLKEHYEGKSFSLDNIPPPIYKWDMVFNKKDDNDCDIELDSFSSGEKQMLNTIGAIIYHLQNLAHTASKVKYNNINLVLEEIELYYHPEYQRQFFNRLLDLIQRAKLENIQNINIVFVTHSPFILSDIPKCNVLFLKDGMPKDIMQENTFGANIHTLLKNGFFMPNLPIGEFAYGKINALFKKLNIGDFNNDDEEKRKKDLNDIYQQILLVGEPFLRNQLLLLYNSYKGSRVMPMNTNKKGG